MELSDDTWHVIKSTPKVTGFVGGATNPPPVSDEEVRDITQQMQEGAIKPKPKVLFETGESVKVIDGPFQDFSGVVEDVKPEKGKLRVLISIFGRATPVELELRPGGTGVARGLRTWQRKSSGRSNFKFRPGKQVRARRWVRPLVSAA